MFQCPGCGGNLKFDIPSQQLGCEYCGGKYSPYDFEKKTSDAIEGTAFEDDYEVTIFTCPQCGGEILSTDNAAAGFCSFCGASTILYSRISREHRPNYIIPFKKTKEDCKQAYADLMKKAIFAPNELKNIENIDSFRGIYMPYWAYYVTQAGPIRFPANKSYRRGDYVITDHYSLEGNLDAYYKGISYDASSSFSDNISECLAPYDVKGMKAFTPAFLSGFYADTADVAQGVYQAQAEDIAYKQSLSSLQTVPAFRGYSVEAAATGNPSLLNTRTAAVDQAMFPVWFMSYRNKDRVAYATVNGQTGKVVADLPVDMKKYLLGSLVLSLPLFLLLCIFLTVVPSTLMLICGVLAITAAVISFTEMTAIVRKETDADDLGVTYANLKKNPTAAQPPAKKKKGSASASSLISVIVIFGLVFGISTMFGDFSDAIIWVGLLVTAIVLACIGIPKVQKIPQKRGLAGLLISLFVILAGSAVRFLSPPADWIYYVVSSLSLIGVFFSLKEVIDEHNILSTRRLPQFNKQGGDDRA